MATAARVAAGPDAAGGVRVRYGDDVTRPGIGGAVKFSRLATIYPPEEKEFTVLYLGSSTVPAAVSLLVRAAHHRGAAVVWNQDGVAYPAWHGRGWKRLNHRLAAPFHAADHVFFQSEFCRLSAEKYLGRRDAPSEILYNAVDTTLFTPETPPSEATILLGGTQYQRYRFETALRTVALLPELRLLVSGALSWSPTAPAEARELIGILGLDRRVTLLGPYRPENAPVVLRQAHLLLHTKVNDPCPNVVIEAMACGLPVVYSASGGTPELVGDDAGVGIETALDWEREVPPRPEELAEAVTAVLDRLDEYRTAARRRAVERFDLAPWLARHEEVFRCLVS